MDCGIEQMDSGPAAAAWDQAVVDGDGMIPTLDIIRVSIVPFCWCCPILDECIEHHPMRPDDLRRGNCATEFGWKR
jgi:hypothetical protein